MTDVLSKLPRMSFRGIVLPITGRATAGFSHEDVSHKFLYRNGELIESMGSRNWEFHYTVPMRQDIAVGPYRDLFTVVLPKLVVALRDRTPGELVDPVLGLFRAQPKQVTSEVDVNKRDGTDLEISFTHAPELEDIDVIEIPGTLASAKSQAGELDAQVAQQDWEQEPSPEPSVDPLSAIDGIGSQFEFAANRTAAALDDAAFRLRKIEETADRLENPQLWPLRRSARNLRLAVHKLKAHGDDPGRRIALVSSRYAKTAMETASELGMTLNDLITLNPDIVPLDIIPAGMRLRRYV